ncbi:MAG: hypothetical protein HDKAJFGB_02725 [Anaerolineae bacterium]|nr:hypothetical protein [Anaerolineae bacterium]
MTHSQQIVLQGTFARFTFLLGALLIIFAAAILVIATVFFAFGLSLSGWTFLCAALLTGGVTAFGARLYFPEASPKYFILLVGSAVLIVGIALWTQSNFFDFSSDGQTYHTSALWELARGWNPILGGPLSTGVSSADTLNSYSKGPWILAAVIYQLTGQLETAKAFNIVLLGAAFLITFATLETWGVKRWLAFVIAVVASINPVVMTQLLSLFVDGLLASLLLILVCLGLLLLRGQDPLLLSTVGASVILAVNIKLSAIAYVLLFGVAIVAWRYLIKRNRDKLTALVFVASYLGGVLLIGFNPYVTNTLRFGNPFYPTNDWTTFLVVTKNTPENLVGKNPLHKLALSLFARSQLRPEFAERKMPFTFDAAELAAFEGGETRVAGFGPLFSGAVVTSALLVIVILADSWRRRRFDWDWLFMTALVAGSVIINPEAWWARYAPQLWLIPVLLATIALRSGIRWIQLVGLVTIAILLLNCALIGTRYFGAQANKTARLRAQLTQVAALPAPATVYFSNFISNRLRFDQIGIEYVSIDQPSCPNALQLVGSETRVCLPAP